MNEILSPHKWYVNPYNTIAEFMKDKPGQTVAELPFDRSYQFLSALEAPEVYRVNPIRPFDPPRKTALSTYGSMPSLEVRKPIRYPMQKTSVVQDCNGSSLTPNVAKKALVLLKPVNLGCEQPSSMSLVHRSSWRGGCLCGRLTDC